MIRSGRKMLTPIQHNLAKYDCFRIANRRDRELVERGGPRLWNQTVHLQGLGLLVDVLEHGMEVRAKRYGETLQPIFATCCK